MIPNTGNPDSCSTLAVVCLVQLKVHSLLLLILIEPFFAQKCCVQYRLPPTQHTKLREREGGQGRGGGRTNGHILEPLCVIRMQSSILFPVFLCLRPSPHKARKIRIITVLFLRLLLLFPGSGEKGKEM